MEKDLFNRLVKVADENACPSVYPDALLILTSATLSAVKAHIEETLPGRETDIITLRITQDLLKDYV